tara:strand:+ start:570 stop:755 length:186 start_codon:yes stop_codon:yes gene_type:complete
MPYFQQKLKDAIHRIDQFKERYDNGEILQEVSEEEFLEIMKQMYIEIWHLRFHIHSRWRKI